jgi:hypothetical protein
MNKKVEGLLQGFFQSLSPRAPIPCPWLLDASQTSSSRILQAMISVKDRREIRVLGKKETERGTYYLAGKKYFGLVSELDRILNHGRSTSRGMK